MTRFLVTTLIVVLAATSAWLWHSLGLERERFDRLQAKVTGLGQSPGSTLESPVAVTPASLELPKQPGNDERGMTRRLAGFISPGSNPTLLKDKDYVAARNGVHEALFAMQYAGLAQVLDVPQGVVDQLIAIKARQFVRQLDAVPPNLADVPGDTLELQRQQDRLEGDTEMATLIGEGKLQEFKEYESSFGERQHVKELRLELLDSPEPLAGDRSERLIRALYQERLRFDEEMAAMLPPQEAERQSMDHFVIGREYVAEREAELERRLLRAAEAVLSPAQLKAYRKMLEVQSRVNRASMEATRARSAAMGRTPEDD